MDKHTSSPWWVEVNDTYTNIESKYYTIAADVSNNDADLIATAPELLKALKDAHIRLKNVLPIIENIESVIKKAEGKKQ